MKRLNQKGLLFAVLLVPFVSGCALLVATGVGTGVAMSQDRRTNGTFIEDEAIEMKSDRRISEKYGGNVHVNITSFNRHVLLTGEAPSEAAKADVGDLVNKVENVR